MTGFAILMRERQTRPVQMLLPPRIALGLLLLPVLALAGCGATSIGSDASAPVSPPVVAPPVVVPPVAGTYAGAAFGGRVLAGQVPVSGASVQMYAAGTSGNGVAAGALLAAPVVTDSSGSFQVAAGYICPVATSQVYLVASGGKSGVSANAAIMLLTAVGGCSGIASASQYVVNEVTTVAGVFALSQFLAAGGGIGATSTNATGLANGFRTAAGLASTATGVSPGTTFPGNAVAPTARINTLANLLNTCTGAAAPATACGALFAGATAAGGVAPGNTLDAVFNLARNPALNQAALYGLARASSAFAPALAAVPADWSLFVTVSGGGMSGPSTLGITSAGGVWVANFFNVASLFTPLGAPVFPSGITGFGLNSSYGMAVDAADNAWIANRDGQSVTELTTAGVALSGAGIGYTAGGINFPIAVAIDPDTRVWVVDYGNGHLTQLNASGQPLSGPAGYASDQIAFPTAIAIDGSHNGWIVNQAGTTITRLSQDGRTAASANCCNTPSGIAIDQRGDVWVTNFLGDSVSQVSSTLVVKSSGFTGGGLSRPQGIAIDGSGNVWVASFRGLGIAEFAGSQAAVPGAVLSPAGGWARDAPLLSAFSIAIDASGNLWIANFGNSTVTEVIGLAAPVRTPLSGPVQAP